MVTMRRQANRRPTSRGASRRSGRGSSGSKAIGCVLLLFFAALVVLVLAEVILLVTRPAGTGQEGGSNADNGAAAKISGAVDASRRARDVRLEGAHDAAGLAEAAAEGVRRGAERRGQGRMNDALVGDSHVLREEMLKRRRRNEKEEAEKNTGKDLKLRVVDVGERKGRGGGDDGAGDRPRPPPTRQSERRSESKRRRPAEKKKDEPSDEKLPEVEKRVDYKRYTNNLLHQVGLEIEPEWGEKDQNGKSDDDDDDEGDDEPAADDGVVDVEEEGEDLDDEAAADDDKAATGDNVEGKGKDVDDKVAQDDDDKPNADLAEEAAKGNEGAKVLSPRQKPPAKPRRSLEDILDRAGVEVTPELHRKLPSAEEAEWLYGGEPVIVGLDKCEEFRQTVKGEDRYIGVAGIFNTGTNLLSDLLTKNCYIPEKVKKFGENKIGMRGQVPWGKHSPMSWRGHHVALGGADDVIQTDVLPAVVVKDPYSWMTSMCRHEYAAIWHHTEGHCPNLVPETDEEREDEQVQSPEGNMGKTIPVRVKYRETKVTKHESLAGLWNDWYQPWTFEAAFPRVIVRFEDLLLRAEEVVGTVCHCGGGEMRQEFQYDVETAKHGAAHKGASGMTSAIVRYTNATLRLEPYHEKDLEYAAEALRPDLMEAFGYQYGIPRIKESLQA